MSNSSHTSDFPPEDRFDLTVRFDHIFVQPRIWLYCSIRWTLTVIVCCRSQLSNSISGPLLLWIIGDCAIYFLDWARFRLFIAGILSGTLRGGDTGWCVCHILAGCNATISERDSSLSPLSFFLDSERSLCQGSCQKWHEILVWDLFLTSLASSTRTPTSMMISLQMK